MSRKKKNVEAVQEVQEVVTPMKEDAMNPPVEDTQTSENDVVVGNEEVVAEEKKVEEEKPIIEKPKKAEPLKKRIKSTSSLVNVRESPEGAVLFRLQNQSPIIVEEEQGDWVKISGWVMKALVGER